MSWISKEGKEGEEKGREREPGQGRGEREREREMNIQQPTATKKNAPSARRPTGRDQAGKAFLMLQHSTTNRPVKKNADLTFDPDDKEEEEEWRGCERKERKGSMMMKRPCSRFLLLILFILSLSSFRSLGCCCVMPEVVHTDSLPDIALSPSCFLFFFSCGGGTLVIRAPSLSSYSSRHPALSNCQKSFLSPSLDFIFPLRLRFRLEIMWYTQMHASSTIWDPNLTLISRRGFLLTFSDLNESCLQLTCTSCWSPERTATGRGRSKAVRGKVERETGKEWTGCCVYGVENAIECQSGWRNMRTIWLHYYCNSFAFTNTCSFRASRHTHAQRQERNRCRLQKRKQKHTH